MIYLAPPPGTGSSLPELPASPVWGNEWRLRDDIKALVGDPRWIYSIKKPFTIGDTSINITGGTGFTTGVRTRSNYSAGYNTGADGLQNLLFFDPAVAAANSTGGSGYVLREYGTQNILCWGNSLTFGTGASAGSDYPSQMHALYVADNYPGIIIRNQGTSGDRLSVMEGNYQEQVGNYFEYTNYENNIIVFWELTNELFFNSAVADDALEVFYRLCSRMRRQGWTVVVLTVLPRSDASTPAGFEAARQVVNADLRVSARLGQQFDVLVDVAADTRIGDAGDELDTTYYNADKVHMIGAGYALISTAVKDAVDTLISN